MLRTGDKVGTFYLDVEELSSGMLIGTAVVSAAALDDGCTGFWAAGTPSPSTTPPPVQPPSSPPPETPITAPSSHHSLPLQVLPSLPLPLLSSSSLLPARSVSPLSRR